MVLCVIAKDERAIFESQDFFALSEHVESFDLSLLKPKSGVESLWHFFGDFCTSASQEKAQTTLLVQYLSLERDDGGQLRPPPEQASKWTTREQPC